MSPTTASPKVTIARPDDWHVHLRDDEMLRAVVPHTASVFRYAMVMPNLTPAITSTDAANAYRMRVMAAAGPKSNDEFTPLMVLYLNDNLSVEDLRAGFKDGAVHAAKYYPAGATTNSDDGGSALLDYMVQLETMADIGMPLLVHAESTDQNIDIFDREKAFLDGELSDLCERLPELRVTVEHVSTANGVDFVKEHDGVVASITPHHLTRERSDLLANGLDPHLYCKPIINRASDRDALVAVVVAGNSSFFLGTDSAPHPTTHKHGLKARPGIFNAPHALEVVAELLYSVDALDKLEDFTSQFGAKNYGFEVSSSQLQMFRSDKPDNEQGSSIMTQQGQEVMIFGTEAGRRWSITQQVGDN